MMTIMIIVVMTQAVVPELLMTSAGITFVCLGLFAVFNNPAKEYREQVYWDMHPVFTRHAIWIFTTRRMRQCM